MTEEVERIVAGLLERDVNPAIVARALAAKYAFMREVDALPETRRCKGSPVNHDGSCFACGDDQGEYSRCAVRAALIAQQEVSQ